MAQQLEWRRGLPVRALRRLGWFALAGAVIVAIAWLLFASEPDRLASGEPNPLALVPAVTTVLVAVAVVPALAALLRRPRLRADHYALAIRPGMLRTLMLPWAEVVEVAGRLMGGAPLLLVRCAGTKGRFGDRPRWYDQRLLKRAGPDAALAYDLAVRMDDFAGPSAERLAALAAWAPRHVRFIDDLSPFDPA